MAIQTRYAGDANGIVNVDNGVGSLGYPVSVGLTKAPIALKVLFNNSLTLTAAELATGGAVETVLRAIQVDGTVTMYQVDATNGQISVLLEATGAGTINASESVSSTSEGAEIVTVSNIAADIAARLQALKGAASATAGPTGTTTGGNIGISANVWANSITVTSSNFKLA
jgi:hypothetical protein